MSVDLNLPKLFFHTYPFLFQKRTVISSPIICDNFPNLNFILPLESYQCNIGILKNFNLPVTVGLQAKLFPETCLRPLHCGRYTRPAPHKTFLACGAETSPCKMLNAALRACFNPLRASFSCRRRRKLFAVVKTVVFFYWEVTISKPVDSLWNFSSDNYRLFMDYFQNNLPLHCHSSQKLFPDSSLNLKLKLKRKVITNKH